MRRIAALSLLLPVGLLVTELVSAGTPLHTQTAAGERIYERCAACHSLERDRTGPHHCGLFGRRAGSVAGFAYSEAMKTSGIMWNRASLDTFIANPMRTVPGTYMGYAGIQDPVERAELLDYLEVASQGESCRAVETSVGKE